MWGCWYAIKGSKIWTPYIFCIWVVIRYCGCWFAWMLLRDWLLWMLLWEGVAVREAVADVAARLRGPKSGPLIFCIWIVIRYCGCWFFDLRGLISCHI